MENSTSLITAGLSGLISLASLGVSLYLYRKRKYDEINLKSVQARLDKELQKDVHVYKFQFEKEYKIYEEIWKSLFEFKNYTLSLRPALDNNLADNNNEKLRRLTNWGESHDNFLATMEHNRPFYPLFVYSALEKAMFLGTKEKVQYSHEPPSYDPNFSEYLERAAQNQKNFKNAVEECMEAIRKRIEEMQVKAD